MKTTCQHPKRDLRCPGPQRPVRRERLSILLVALFAPALFNASLVAQTPPPAKPASGRYLFIVDTSSGMRTRSAALQKTVNNLLASGMNAQLRPGDTIGVWTFNEQLFAGQLPLQQWTPATEQLVASNIVAFLKAGKFEKQARFEAVWPELQPLVRESEKLTILLISDGSQPVSGTPYDRDINEFFKINAGKQKQKRLPLVVALRSYRGKFSGFTLNLPPWPVQLPMFPPEPKTAAAPKPKPPPPVKAPPPPAAPPLIVIGKKPEPTPVAPPAPSAATPATPIEPANAVPPVPEMKSPPPAVAPEPPKTAPVGTTSSAVQPALATTIATPTEIAPTVPPTTTQNKPEMPPVSSPPAQSPVSVTPPPAVPAHANEAKPDPVSLPATESQSPSAQLATTSSPEGGVNPKLLLIIGIVLLLFGVLVAFFLLQRRARPSHLSLITRSMDQDNKKQ